MANTPATTPPSEDFDACTNALERLIAAFALSGNTESGLAIRYRPVADLCNGNIFGHIASVHTTPDVFICSAPKLFSIAGRQGKLAEVCRGYFQAAIRRFVVDQGQGFLILPLLNGPTVLGQECATILQAALTEVGLPATRVIAVHPGIGGLDGEQLDHAMAAAHAISRLGVNIAASVISCPRSEKMLWSQLHPGYVMIEKEEMESIDPNLLRRSLYPQLIAEIANYGRQVIAQGTNSPALLKVLQEIKVTCAAGDFIGKPFSIPTRTLSAAAHKIIAGKDSGYSHAHSENGHFLNKLLQHIAPVTAKTVADDVFAIFESNPNLQAITVVREDTPIGLISRYEMIDNMARAYRHELYGRKTCTRFMDKDPLIVDVRVPLLELSQLLVSAAPRHLISGFIITDDGHYLGMGLVQDLVREVTSMQMEAAKYANPLSQLPGNIPINQYIDNLLVTGVPCTIAYCDLDHFKPFNDVYGYARGDDVIRLTARILSDVCDPVLDFIGHIGGDDFIIVFRSEDWQSRCEHALQVFGEQILTFFSRDDVERGGYVTENRKGMMEFHALTSISIGLASIKPGTYQSHLEVSVVAAEVKKKAKNINGNSLYVDKRSG